MTAVANPSLDVAGSTLLSAGSAPASVLAGSAPALVPGGLRPALVPVGSAPARSSAGAAPASVPVGSVPASVPVGRRLGDLSLETTAGAVGELAALSGLIPPGTRVAIPFLDGDDLPALATAARAVGELGFHPVPHLAARRIESAGALVDHLETLRGVTEEVFLVGGDPITAVGPFPDALTLLRSGLLAEHGIRHVGLPGYPAGHPLIEDRRLWADFVAKAGVLRAQGLDGHVTTQFATPEQVAKWLDRARARGIDLPVRVGVPGPAGLPPALAARLATQDPRMLKEVGAGAHREAEIPLHFSTFGALRDTIDWITHQAAGTGSL